MQIFTDHGVSGKASSRPQWDACRTFLRRGDALVVTKIDRISRSVGNLIEVVGQLGERGDMPAKRIAEVVGISRASLYRALQPGGRQPLARQSSTSV